jgi:hypothetical protein
MALLKKDLDIVTVIDIKSAILPFLTTQSQVVTHCLTLLQFKSILPFPVESIKSVQLSETFIKKSA